MLWRTWWYINRPIVAGVMAVKINSRLAPTQWLTITGCSEVDCFLVGGWASLIVTCEELGYLRPNQNMTCYKEYKSERCASMYNVCPFRLLVFLFQECVSVCMHFLLSRAGLVCHCLSSCGNQCLVPPPLPHLHPCVDPPSHMFIGIMWMHTQAL